ncbi:MAG: ACT domain-containing protein [Actinobacteria bacterium]|nr:ACT domain-containing protein [Actinomycetota bacterium]
MNLFTLTAIGNDRPGIVSAVTGVLLEAGCNLQDSSMTLLRGQFAIMLVVAAQDGTTVDDLERKLAGVASMLDLVVSVRSLDNEIGGLGAGAGAGDQGNKDIDDASEAWVVAVHGADRPGIVHRITQLLAEAGANIVDLSTRVIGEPDKAVYVMVMDVVVPSGANGSILAHKLEEAASKLAIHTSMHPADPDIL